jgi:hypothetical protein
MYAVRGVRWGRVASLLLGLLGGCGRLAFDDVARDGAVASCVGKPFGAAQPLSSVNTLLDDWSGAPTLGGAQLFLHSDRPSALGGTNIFVAEGAAPDAYGTPALVAEVSTMRDEFQPTLSADGLDMILVSDQGDPYLLELWESTRASTSSAWSKPSRIAELGTDARHELDPWLSADGLSLYYAIGDNLAAATLVRATRASRLSRWDAPVAVPGIVGAGAFAVSPTLSTDEREIFFATDLDAAGNLDIVTARRSDRDAPFGPLVRVGGLNTAGDEAGLRLSEDGRYLYFVQNTDYEIGGNADIMYAPRDCE